MARPAATRQPVGQPSYYQILREFKRRTGFHREHQPNSKTDRLHPVMRSGLQKGHLDVLAIDLLSPEQESVTTDKLAQTAAREQRSACFRNTMTFAECPGEQDREVETRH
jgi:hypothetical protein